MVQKCEIDASLDASISFFLCLFYQRIDFIIIFVANYLEKVIGKGLIALDVR